MEMEWLIIIVFFFFLFGGHAVVVALLADRNQKKRLKEKQEFELKKLEAQKQLEAQRFEQLKDLATDTLITGNPVAVKTLEPLVKALAKQIEGKQPKQLPENTD